MLKKPCLVLVLLTLLAHSGIGAAQTICAASGRNLAKVRGDRLYDASGKTIGRLYRNTLYDESGRTIGRTEDVPRRTAILYFYFFSF